MVDVVGGFPDVRQDHVILSESSPEEVKHEQNQFWGQVYTTYLISNKSTYHRDNSTSINEGVEDPRYLPKKLGEPNPQLTKSS